MLVSISKTLLPVFCLLSMASAVCEYNIEAYADQSCDGNSLIESFGQDSGNVQCHKLPAGYQAKCYIITQVNGGDACAHNNKLCLGSKDEGGVTSPCVLPNFKRCVKFDGPVRFTHAGSANIFAINPPGA